MNTLFEVATREKYRFPFKGSITVEDLWDLSEKDLDAVYKMLKREEKDGEEDSLIGKASGNSVLANKIQLVEYVYKKKNEERLARLAEREKRERMDKIAGIIERKEDAALENASIEELKSMLANM